MSDRYFLPRFCFHTISFNLCYRERSSSHSSFQSQDPTHSYIYSNMPAPPPPRALKDGPWVEIIEQPSSKSTRQAYKFISCYFIIASPVSQFHDDEGLEANDNFRQAILSMVDLSCVKDLNCMHVLCIINMLVTSLSIVCITWYLWCRANLSHPLSVKNVVFDFRTQTIPSSSIYHLGG